jgi:RNA polymerase sigma factor (TIGR02999 family)
MVSGGPSSSERNGSKRVSEDDALQSEAVTRLLVRVRQGDFAAREELLPLVYGELRRLAGIAFRQEAPGNTLQPTALVHEAFIRLFSGPVPAFTDRAHFLGISARVMRQVLVDHARARRAQKRGAQFTIQLDDQMAAAVGNSDLLLIDQALDKLGGEDPLLVTLIEMRFFAGMTAEETAEARGESVHVVRHDLRYAQARLRQIVLGDSQPPL